MGRIKSQLTLAMDVYWASRGRYTQDNFEEQYFWQEKRSIGVLITLRCDLVRCAGMISR